MPQIKELTPPLLSSSLSLPSRPRDRPLPLPLPLPDELPVPLLPEIDFDARKPRDQIKLVTRSRLYTLPVFGFFFSFLNIHRHTQRHTQTHTNTNTHTSLIRAAGLARVFRLTGGNETGAVSAAETRVRVADRQPFPADAAAADAEAHAVAADAAAAADATAARRQTTDDRQQTALAHILLRA